MKSLKKIFVALVLLFAFPLVTRASESSLVKEQAGGGTCIDLAATYEEIKNTSQAITGQEQSLDSIKKAQTLANLSNLYSFFMGDKAFCIKDEVAASKANSFKGLGLLGMVEGANNNMLAVYPSLNVGSHLAREFIPGYEENRLYAQDTANTEPEIDSEKELETRQKELQNLLHRDDATEEELEELRQEVEKAKQEEENSPVLDSSGYNYLKDSLKLDKLWSQTRNLAYLFFVLAMIVIGFMIMFRNKIGGQLLVTVGNSIPQLIICLVLVTFSFAISGLMLDLGKVSMKVVEGVFISAQEAAGDGSPTVMNIRGIGRLNDQLMFSFNPFDMISKEVKKVPLVGGLLGKGIDGVVGIWEGSGGVGTGLILTRQALKLFTNSQILRVVRETELIEGTATLTGGPLVAMVGTEIKVTGAIEAFADIILKKGDIALLGIFFILLLFIVICLYASVKLFITIVTTYFKIFINIIIGPLQIASGAIPGNFSAVSNWFKGLAANILVFPVIITILNIFNYLGSNIDPGKFNFFGNKGVFWPSMLLSIRGIFMFAGYLFAANAPALVNGFLKVGENKAMSAVGETVKKTAGKIPVLGGMFGK